MRFFSSILLLAASAVTSIKAAPVAEANPEPLSYQQNNYGGGGGYQQQGSGYQQQGSGYQQPSGGYQQQGTGYQQQGGGNQQQGGGYQQPSNGQQSGGSSETWQGRLLKRHNDYRAKHSAGALAWHSGLEQAAQNWVNTCPNGPNPARTGYGQNYYTFSGFPLGQGLWNAVDSWYNSQRYYPWNNPGFYSQSGSFTQLVWKGSNQLGCAYKNCGQRWVVLCAYGPQGNIVWQGDAGRAFRENVSQN